MNNKIHPSRTACFLSALAAPVISAALLGGVPAVGEQPPAAMEPTRAARPADPRPSAEASIQALVRQGRLDAAESLAREQMDTAGLSSDEAAKAAVALASMRVATLLRAPLAQQQTLLEAAMEPLQRVLRAYPDHRRAPWLRFQLAAVEIAVAQRQAAVLAATPGDEPLRLTVLATLIESSLSLEELEREVAESITAAFEARDRTNWIDELMALRNAIAVKRVEVLLRRGELFTAGSDDALAAAAQAQQAAVAALAMVRDDSARRAELLRMRCEALLRMGQVEQAAALLRPLLGADTDTTNDSPDPVNTRTLDDATRALAVRLALELGQVDRAEQLLASHYGQLPAEAAAAPESDLARLRYLIAAKQLRSRNDQEQKQQIGDWIDALRRRGGDFAQRRAEAIVVELLGRSSGGLTDPRIVIAMAASELRAGKAVQAAEMLATAARQTSEPVAARQLAIAGAAAYDSAGDDLAAAQLLLDVTRAHEGQPESAELQLQAAVLLDRIARDKAKPVPAGAETTTSAVSTGAAQVDELLRETLQRWPGEPAAAQARRWLLARLVHAEQRVEAAIVASPTEDPAATPEQWEAAAALWTEALVAVPLLTTDLAVDSAAERLTLQALEHLPTDVPAAARCGRRLIALFGSFELVLALQRADDDEPFIEWLLAVRGGRQPGPPPLEAVSPQIREAAVQRLVADGVNQPQKRPHLAAAIRQLESDRSTLPQAIALLWSQDWQRADAVLDRWVQDRHELPAQAAAITAAKVLSRAAQPDAKRRALERFTAAGAQLTQGSAAWHAVKLATLELLSELDQQQEAARLATYILLTRPPEDPAIRTRYRRWSEP